MKIFLRLFGLVLIALALGVFGSFTLILLRIRTDLPLLFTWVLTAILVVICLRVGCWLWSDQPFWKNRKRTAEVATAATAFLGIGATAQLEKATEGSLRTLVQLAAIGFVVTGYFIFRRVLPTAEASNNSAR